MSNNFEQMPSVDNFQQLEKWLGKPQPAKRVPKNPKAKQDYQSRQYEASERRISLWRTGKAALLGTTAIALSGVILGGVGFFNNVNAHTPPLASVKGSVLAPGKGTVEAINMVMPPITVATVETNAKVKVGLDTIVANMDLGEQSLTRTSLVEVHINVDPGSVLINYDDATKQLTETVPNSALSSEVFQKTGSQLDVGSYSNPLLVGVDLVSSAANAIGGMSKTDASDVPLIGFIADKKMSSDNVLRAFADVDAAYEVGNTCITPITQVPTFTDQLKSNIQTAVAGELVHPDAAHKDAISGLKILMSKSLEVRQKIIDNAVIELTPHYTVGRDPQIANSIQKYVKSGLFKVNVDNGSSFDCKISSNLKFTSSNGGTSN